MVSPGPAPRGRASRCADIGIPPQLGGAADGLATPRPARPRAAKTPRHQVLGRLGAGDRRLAGVGRRAVAGAPRGAAGRRRDRLGGGAAAMRPRTSRPAAELMVRALPGALELVERAGAVALGPGLGRAPEALELARRSWRPSHPGPLVIDADALHAFAGELERWPAAAPRPCSPRTRARWRRCWAGCSEWVQANRLRGGARGRRESAGGGAAEGRRHADHRRPAARSRWSIRRHARACHRRLRRRAHGRGRGVPRTRACGLRRPRLRPPRPRCRRGRRRPGG